MSAQHAVSVVPRSLMVMAAGTGGHIMPGLAVAEEMRGRGWTVTWLGTTTGMENRLVPARGFPLDRIGFSGLRGKGLWYAMTGGVRLLNAMRQSFAILRNRKPDAVLGMGGYATVPGGLMASISNIPLIIHNADASMLLSTGSWHRSPTGCRLDSHRPTHKSITAVVT